MRLLTLIVLVVMAGMLLAGCAQSGPPSGYAAYNGYGAPAGQQGQYVGGGCGVAPQTDYGDTPALVPVDAGA